MISRINWTNMTLNLSRSRNLSNRWWFIINIPEKMDSLKAQYNTTVLLANKKAPQLEGGHYTKMMACGLSNMKKSHQNDINSSSKYNSKVTLIWTSRNYAITSRCVSIQLIDSNKASLGITITSKYSLSFNNTSCQIDLALPILGIHRHTITLDSRF